MSLKNELTLLLDDAMEMHSLNRLIAIQLHCKDVVAGFISHPDEIEKLFRIKQTRLFDTFSIENDLAYYLFQCVYRPIRYKEQEHELYKLCDPLIDQNNIIYLPSAIKQEVELLAQDINPLSTDEFVDFLLANQYQACQYLIEYYQRSSDENTTASLLAYVDLNKPNFITKHSLPNELIYSFLSKHYEYNTSKELDIYETDYGVFVGDGGEFIKVLKTHGTSYMELKEIIKEATCLHKKTLAS